MNRPTLTMLCGLPGSGKSTYAKQLSDETNAIICSSDATRRELFGNENLQENNDTVFKRLHSRIKENLKNGHDVIYDATNIHSKRRRAFLSELRRIKCVKQCVIISTPFQMCCEQNKWRDRIVPYEVIKRMYINWNTSYWFEGWDQIEIKFPTDYEFSCIENWVREHMGYNQDNPYHSCTLGQHSNLCGEKLKDNTVLYYAGLLHDCGKPFTKSFVNSKGEETTVAHYYQHHCCGSYDSLFFNYPSHINRIDVSLLINLHMLPYFWEHDEKYGEKTMLKYRKLWGEALFEKVMILHEADKMSH